MCRTRPLPPAISTACADAARRCAGAGVAGAVAARRGRAAPQRPGCDGARSGAAGCGSAMRRIGLAFSAATLRLLRWLLATPLAVPSVAPRVDLQVGDDRSPVAPRPMTVGDQVMVYLALDAAAGTPAQAATRGAAAGPRGAAGVARASPSCSGPAADLRLDSLCDGAGAIVVEALDRRAGAALASRRARQARDRGAGRADRARRSAGRGARRLHGGVRSAPAPRPRRVRDRCRGAARWRAGSRRCPRGCSRRRRWRAARRRRVAAGALLRGVTRWAVWDQAHRGVRFHRRRLRGGPAACWRASRRSGRGCGAGCGLAGRPRRRWRPRQWRHRLLQSMGREPRDPSPGVRSRWCVPSTSRTASSSPLEMLPILRARADGGPARAASSRRLGFVRDGEHLQAHRARWRRGHRRSRGGDRRGQARAPERGSRSRSSGPPGSGSSARTRPRRTCARSRSRELDERLAAKTEELRRAVTAQLEAKIADLKKELDGAIGRATVGALTEKAGAARADRGDPPGRGRQRHDPGEVVSEGNRSRRAGSRSHCGDDPGGAETELPAELSAFGAVDAAYPQELAHCYDALRRRLPVLIECEKELAPYVYRSIRDRLKADGTRCLYLDGRAANDLPPPPPGAGLVAAMIHQIREIVRGAVGERIVVLPHLDILTAGAGFGTLGSEAREVIPLLYENPEVLWLGFKDPAFPLPAPIENLFPHRETILGIPRDRLRPLVTQREARKLGRGFDPVRAVQARLGGERGAAAPPAPVADRRGLPGRPGAGAGAAAHRDADRQRRAARTSISSATSAATARSRTGSAPRSSRSSRPRTSWRIRRRSSGSRA